MQQLDEPIIYKLDSELAFILITELDLSIFKNDFITGRGKKYVYEEGYLEESREIYEVSFSLTAEGHGEVVYQLKAKKGLD